MLGDAHATDRALDMAAAFRNPEVAAAAVAADRGDPAGEAELAKHIAGVVATQLLKGGAAPPRPRPPAPTMAGMAARREASAREAQGTDPLGIGGEPRKAPA
jgi:hypothetical protein